METIAIISIACGSITEGVPCETSNMRDDAAVHIAAELLARNQGIEPIIIPTGYVPRVPGGTTLAELKRNNINRLLVQAGLLGRVRVRMAEAGVDSFSEARYVTGKMLKRLGVARMILVSSNWYMPYGGVIWQRRANERGIPLELHPVVTPAGEKTITMYRRNAEILKTAIKWYLLWLLEPAVTAFNSRRLRGFQWSGCD